MNNIFNYFLYCLFKSFYKNIKDLNKPLLYFTNYNHKKAKCNIWLFLFD